jgi:hypothetical protein
VEVISVCTTTTKPLVVSFSWLVLSSLGRDLSYLALTLWQQRSHFTRGRYSTLDDELFVFCVLERLRCT